MTSNTAQPIRVLSFDIEDWFHILDFDGTRSPETWAGRASRVQQNTARIVESLLEAKTRATFFCLGWVARQYPAVVRSIAAHGFDIGSHSFAHQLAYDLGPRAFRDDLRQSIDTLEQIIGKKVLSYRVPGFSFTAQTSWAFEALAECGIQYDSSVFPASRGHGGFATFGSAVPTTVRVGGAEIREFPINTAQILGRSVVFSGGGYFRLMPYLATRSLMRKARYVMTYFHPREFDPDQPRIPNLPLARRFKYYVGVSGAFAKFQKMLREFSFVDLPGAADRVDWQSAPVHVVEK